MDARLGSRNGVIGGCYAEKEEIEEARISGGAKVLRGDIGKKVT